jgi:AcrR family transcriptional regulator
MSAPDPSSPAPATPAPTPGSTREALLDAAEALFAERGYAAGGLREIVARADANLSAVKYHFGSKRDLYLAAVERAMERGGTAGAWALLDERPRDAEAAARCLGRFVRAMLQRLHEGPELFACGRLVLHEAMRPSEALDVVVEHFVRPHEESLVLVLAPLAPALGGAELLRAARSILGQLLHYLVFRSFLEGPGRADLSDPDELRAIADHVVRFSLRGLGASDALLDRALAEPAPELAADAMFFERIP